ncbi:hypothetical protein [Herbaspirillum sp. RV1423]|uniref:hypothetical protein n=1 Tax=Herbaspirillum sp. RV1423 TaxID=1443993 RepID=UPI0004BB3C0B|nr:hypothetical protein [Herbaspirillum sp. RV1423]
MAINWIAAFKLIPWSDVVQATPTVVRGAKDLWARTKKAKSVTREDAGIIEADSNAELTQRITQLESEQLEASALINTLAEQNAQLVAALDNLRTRLKMLFAACVLLTLGGLALWLR